MWKQLQTSSTWRRVTSSDDFKLCGSITRHLPNRVCMYPAITDIIPLDNDTAVVSNTCIKTLLSCCCSWVMLSATCRWARIDNPSRWTVDSRRWCRCGTELLYCVTSIRRQINLRLILVNIAKRDFTLCWQNDFIPGGAIKTSRTFARH